MQCVLCQSPDRQHVFNQRLLGRHDVAYGWCTHCGLLQTETPHWLEEAYERPIADTDTGILERNLGNARLLKLLLSKLFRPDGRFIDVAGGYGVLTRLLRDRGFDCWRSDKYCANLFADGFDAPEDLQAEALFAFEVLEHVPDPLAFVSDVFQRHGCRNLVFSTQTFGDKQTPPEPGWWYYSLESGQHITFYQPRTLAVLAGKLGCHYTRINDAMHLFTAEPLKPWFRTVLRKRRLRLWAERRCWEQPGRPSLTWADHELAKARLQAALNRA